MLNFTEPTDSRATRAIPADRKRLAGSVLAILLVTQCGCGLFGGTGAQVKQLQAENDRLVSEYRAQRDRLAKLQETNTTLEARVSEAEKLLARSGNNLPASRLSQVPNRGSGSVIGGLTSGNASNSGNGSLGNGGSSFGGNAPPYVPPADSSGNGMGNGADAKWRPMRRQ